MKRYLSTQTDRERKISRLWNALIDSSVIERDNNK